MKKNLRKEIIEKIIEEKPVEACLVKNKYKVLVGMIKRRYPNNFEKIPLNVWEDIIFDSINGNREWQQLTEGYDKVNKKRLSQEKQIELGYVPGYNKDIKLNKLL
jgi:hypothetical protein